MQLLQERQTLSAPGVRRLWGWGSKHSHTVSGTQGARWSPGGQQHPTALELLPGPYIPGVLGPGLGPDVTPLELSRGRAGGVVSSTLRREHGHISTSSQNRDSTDDLGAPSILMPPESWLPQTQNVGPRGSLPFTDAWTESPRGRHLPRATSQVRPKPEVTPRHPAFWLCPGEAQDENSAREFRLSPGRSRSSSSCTDRSWLGQGLWPGFSGSL